jgi:hypothetical protein
MTINAASYYNNATGTQSIANATNIPFPSFAGGVGSSITYDAIQNQFTIGTSGTYLIEYGLSVSTMGSQVILRRNTIALPSTRLQTGNASSRQMSSIATIVSLTAGDIVELRNVGGSSLSLAASTTSTNNVVAYINFVRIN